MGVQDCFHTITKSVDVGIRKPHPAIFEMTLRALDINASQAVYIGDSYRADYQGAQAIGLQAILIDESGQHDVPPAQRVCSVLDVRSAITRPQPILTLS